MTVDLPWEGDDAQYELEFLSLLTDRLLRTRCRTRAIAQHEGRKMLRGGKVRWVRVWRVWVGAFSSTIERQEVRALWMLPELTREDVELEITKCCLSQ